MMRRVTKKSVEDVIELSRTLGEFAQIERGVRLPNGKPETDSHHSFALALVAFEFASKYAPELDAKKIMLYCLVHDLAELVTGDMSTLLSSQEELAKKAKRDAVATEEIAAKMQGFAPHIVEALKAYEAKEDEESMFVYWIDKMMTVPHAFFDNGAHLRSFGFTTHAHAKDWYDRVLVKLQRNGHKPHQSAAQILELAYVKLRDELMDPVLD